MFKVVFSYAFRPFYAAASIYVTLIVLLWYPLGFQGNANYPSLFWHGHEMIWGFAGAIIVGFLLTAVSNWTNTAPIKEYRLFFLFFLWLLARIFVYMPLSGGIYLSTLFDVLFYFSSALIILMLLIKNKNYNNIMVPFVLLVFGGVNVLFCLAITGFIHISILIVMQFGLLGVAVFIGLIGSRVIPFFTSITLKQDNKFSKSLTMVSFLVPIIIMIFMLFSLSKYLILFLGGVVVISNFYQMARWWDNQVLSHPLLWILYAGFFFTTIGVAVLSYAYSIDMGYLSLSTHLIAIGGIGSMTLGMMSRTTLGHTGRAMVLPSHMNIAFFLILMSVLVRVLSIFLSNNSYLLIVSALLFSCAFLIFLYRFLPMLLTPNQTGSA